jgi:16S rRNA processing protein RimM
MKMSGISKVTIGQISRVRGVKGEIVVFPLTDDLGRFLKLQKVLISKGKETQKFLIERARRFQGKVLLKLQGVESPEEAKKLVGGFIEIDKEQLVKLPEGRYFIFDLIGLEVVTTKGERIGRVKEVIPLSANDIFLVEGDKREYDIPAIKDVVKKIDLETKEMIIEPIEGLLEL